MAELVDARDLKSLDGNVVWVRVPPPAPKITATSFGQYPSLMDEKTPRGYAETDVVDPIQRMAQWKASGALTAKRHLV